MTFWNWLKSLFKPKPAPVKVEPLPRVNPSKPVSAKEERKRVKPPWYVFAKKYQGKNENDPEFAKMMIPKWKLFGMNLGAINTKNTAWCGLAMAVALSGVGIDYAKNGALARNWQKYGIEINWKRDGIPTGAVVAIQHDNSCVITSNNHVAQAEGDCTIHDFFDSNGKLKPGATIDLYGGNQGNTWKVSTYSVKEICAVRWPDKDILGNPVPRPVLPVTKSEDCTSKNQSKESTR